jgi:hypothetical protein
MTFITLSSVENIKVLKVLNYVGGRIQYKVEEQNCASDPLRIVKILTAKSLEFFACPLHPATKNMNPRN